MQRALYKYILLLGDNALVLGHRLSELCGHGPSLETDIALTNMSLDYFGQVRNYFQYAAELEGGSEDSIAFLRKERQYVNCLLVEQKNTDFAYIIMRQFLFDHWYLLILESLCSSKDERINAIANKAIKEVKYHHRFSETWVQRLAGGTSESFKRIQDATTFLYPYTQELIVANAIEVEMHEAGIGPDLKDIGQHYYDQIHTVFNKTGLQKPEENFFHKGGKEGIHTEHLGFILAELQYMQRTYPNMQW